MSGFTICWAEESDRPEIGRFLSAAVARDASYISHGEVQDGLSLDGESWAPNLETLFAEDLADHGPDRRILIARAANGALRAAAIVLETVTPRVRYIVIEDIAVDPQARSAGLGQRMLAFIETDARARGAGWAFLESGLRNDGAHRFFERHGYAPISKVFAKKF